MPKLTHSKTFLNKIISFIFEVDYAVLAVQLQKKKKKQERQIMLIKTAK